MHSSRKRDDRARAWLSRGANVVRADAGYRRQPLFFGATHAAWRRAATRARQPADFVLNYFGQHKARNDARRANDLRRDAQRRRPAHHDVS